MFKTNRVKFGMKARALEETAKEIKNSLGSADEYYYYDDLGTLRGQGGIGAILEYMMHEVPYTKEYPLPGEEERNMYYLCSSGACMQPCGIETLRKII